MIVKATWSDDYVKDYKTESVTIKDGGRRGVDGDRWFNVSLSNNYTFVCPKVEVVAESEEL